MYSRSGLINKLKWCVKDMICSSRRLFNEPNTALPSQHDPRWASASDWREAWLWISKSCQTLIWQRVCDSVAFTAMSDKWRVGATLTFIWLWHKWINKTNTDFTWTDLTVTILTINTFHWTYVCGVKQQVQCKRTVGPFYFLHHEPKKN